MASGKTLKGQLDDVAALSEPVRRDLYLHVAGQAGPVSREEAASALGINRSLAAFHLDKLVEAGLLEAEYRRLSGKTGPGAGRPSKLYRRSERQVHVALPRRNYELLARILSGAITEAAAQGRGAGDAPARSAHALGLAFGSDARRRAGTRPKRERLVEAVEHSLEAIGYEPYRWDGEIRLRNCPFHALVEDFKPLVCGLNLSLVRGVLEGVRAPDMRGEPTSRPGECCVTVVRGQ
jgi:predicted ArsR family transcriptional regulator